jgi:hypothetical protein
MRLAEGGCSRRNLERQNPRPLLARVAQGTPRTSRPRKEFVINESSTALKFTLFPRERKLKKKINVLTKKNSARLDPARARSTGAALDGGAGNCLGSEAVLAPLVARRALGKSGAPCVRRLVLWNFVCQAVTKCELAKPTKNCW